MAVRLNMKFYALPKLVASTLFAFLLAGSLRAQTPAFPGALGFGAYATGGRGGTVVHVSNLNDSGTGSFRDAVSHSGRIVVFDVGGHIKLSSAVTVQGNTTIAGQTAPGGICFDAGEISFSPRANIICRYVRIRPGSDTASTGDDCLSLYKSTNCILDHCSLAFGPWNNIDAVTCNNISVQHCIDSNPIYQQFGAHTENPNANYCWTYNIFANSHNRNPLAKINTVFINNAEYNNSAGYTTHTSTRFKHDIVNNYFVYGPASGSNFPWYQIDNNQSIYASGNYLDSNKNSALDGGISSIYWYQGGGTVLSAPWSSWTAVIPTVSASLAWRYDMSTAGAFPRDDVDSLLVSQMKTLGNGTAGTGAGTAGPSGGLYTSQTQTGLGNNGYGTFSGGVAPVNFSGDGIADYWKLAVGLGTNINYPTTNTASGYCLLENYLNFLAAPHAATQTNTAVDVNLSQFTSGFGVLAAATFSVTNATNGTVSLLNSTNAHFVPTSNFSGLGSFVFTVTESGYALSATVTICVTPATPPASATAFNGAMVAVVTNVSATVVAPPSNLNWRGDGTANVWNTTVSNWMNDTTLAAFKNGDAVNFDDTGSNSPAINVSTTVSPAILVFDHDRNYTFSGSGAWTGSGSLTKDGAGVLFVNTTNSGYTGNIGLNSGALVLGQGASVGSGTITMNGGTLFGLAVNGSTFPANPIYVPSGQSVTITNVGIANGLGGNISSADSTAVLNLPNGLSFTGTTTNQFSGFSGTINIGSSGTLRFSANSGGNTYGSLNPTWIINGILQPRNAGNTIQLGTISGTGSLQGPQTLGTGTGATVYSIGGNNLSSVFGGIIVSNVNSSNTVICLNKVGTGSLTLNGNNTITGTNGVIAGSLFLNGANTPSLCTVYSGATLGGTGTISGVVRVNSGGILSPGSAGTGTGGTLTINSHLTNSSPTLKYDLTANPAGTNDRINMTGTLAMSGTQTFIFNLVDNVLGSGTYNLIEGANNSTQSGVTLTHNLPGTTRQTISLYAAAPASNPSYVRLDVSGPPAATNLVWRGTNGNVWDLATTANWANTGNPDVFYNLDQVTFNDSSTNGTVSISGTVQPATLLVSNNATSFSFNDGAIAGFTALAKTGLGSLTLNASNAYAGGTAIVGGTLNVNNGYALGTGPVALSGGTLHFNSVGPANTITASGTNTLQATSGTANIYTSFALKGSGRLNLTIDGNYVFTPGGDWSGFSGYIYFSGNKSLRAFSANVGSASAIWDLGTGGSIYNRDGGYTVHLGALFGGIGTSISGASSASVGTTTYVVGELNTNCTFNGVISDNSSPTALVKSGTGVLTLTGANTFSDGATVSSGTLRVNNATGSGTGTGDLEVFSGAVLTGTGILASATTIDDGGTLAPGDPSGTLTFTGSVTLNDNSILQFGLGTNSDSVTVGGDLALTGQLNVSDAGGFTTGAYMLFSYGGALDFGALTLASAPDGYNYAFDTNTVGQVKLIVTSTNTLPPQIGTISVSGNQIIMSGSNGTSLGTFYVRASTNLSVPISNWQRILTNQFDAAGNFNVTNALNLNLPQSYYLIELP